MPWIMLEFGGVVSGRGGSSIGVLREMEASAPVAWPYMVCDRCGFKVEAVWGLALPMTGLSAVD